MLTYKDVLTNVRLVGRVWAKPVSHHMQGHTNGINEAPPDYFLRRLVMKAMSASDTPLFFPGQRRSPKHRGWSWHFSL